MIRLFLDLQRRREGFAGGHVAEVFDEGSQAGNAGSDDDDVDFDTECMSVSWQYVVTEARKKLGGFTTYTTQIVCVIEVSMIPGRDQYLQLRSVFLWLGQILQVMSCRAASPDT